MTFITGWLPSDLNNPSNDSIAGPDSVAIKGPSGGFLVPAGATVSNIGFHSKNAVPAKFAIYATDFTLLAETGGATTGGAGDELFLLLADWTPQVDTYVYIAALTSSYLTGIGGDANLRYMPYASEVYADGFPNPFVQAGTANTPKQALWLDGTIAVPGPAITNLNTDNSVTTYQQANANGVSGFGGPITSGTLGGEAVTIIDGDWQSNSGVVSLRVPGSLTTGSYDLVLSDGTDSATLSGVTFTQTHPYEAPYGLVDSNSAWREQRLTPGTRWRVTREFQYITYNYTASQAETPPDGNDLNDHAEAGPGYTGADYQDREVLYSDGTAATYRVNVTVGEGGNITTRRSLRRKLRRALRILLRREL